MRTYVQEVTHCYRCPLFIYVSRGNKKFHTYCNGLWLKNGKEPRTIAKNTSNVSKSDIPKWCPLPKTNVITQLRKALRKFGSHSMGGRSLCKYQIMKEIAGADDIYDPTTEEPSADQCTCGFHKALEL